MAKRVKLQTEQSEDAPAVNTAQERYAKLTTDRESYLTRAREAAALTIPSLFPPEGHNGTSRLPQPWQSVGSRGLNNLANKFLLVLFPPGGTFFRQTVSEFTLSKLLGQAQAGGEGAKDVRAELEEALGKIERAAVQRLEERGARMQLFEACRHLVLAGNGLIQVLPDERLKFHRLDRYVLKRDQQGNVTEIVVKETVSKVTLPDDIRALIDTAPATHKTGDQAEDSVDIYTWIRRVGKKWTVVQEANGVTLDAGSGTYPLDKSPWIPIRLISVDGEDYGRGFVEEVIGDLSSYDSLRQAIVEGAAISSRIIPLVDESGITNIKQLNEARNGQAIPGRKRDVEFMQVEKFQDLRVAQESAQDIKRDLQQAFLLLAGSQRDAERVTAEEIRLIAQELETSSGGSYSVLSQEFQYPLASRLLFQMTKKKELPALPPNVVSLQIVTGIAGLGRNSDLSKIDVLISGVSQLFGPEAVAEHLSVGSYIKRRATALALDVEGMVRSDEDVQKARAEQQKMELAKASIGPAAKLAGQQMEQGQPQEGV